MFFNVDQESGGKKKRKKEKKTKHPIIVSTNPNYGTETRVDLHYFRVN